MKDKITFELTGNFQYDIGLLGLKRVLDFFGIEYKNDDYSLTIDNRIWCKLGHYAYLYGYHFRGLEAFAKKMKVKNYSGKNGEFKKLIKDSGSKSFEEFMALLIDIFKKDEKKEVINNMKIAGAAYTALNVMNVSHLNMFNPGDMKKIKHGNLDRCIYYKRFVNKFEREAKPSQQISERTCDFCQRYEGEPLNRTNFLFAPAAINLYWFEKTSISICSYCSGLNLFANYGTFTTENNKKYFLYSSNLTALEKDNYIIAKSFEEYVLEYIKHVIEVETEIMDKLFIEMEFRGQEPNIDFLPFSSDLLKFFYENRGLIEKLGNYDFVGKAKTPIVYAFRDTIVSLINGEDLAERIDFITNCIIKQLSGNKNIQGFDMKAINAALIIIEISLNRKTKGVLAMNSLEDFKLFGDKVRARIYAGKSKNAAKNKTVSFASSLRDAVNDSKEKFMETLLQLAIYSEVQIPSSMLTKLTSDEINYKEAGFTVALSLMSTTEKISKV